MSDMEIDSPSESNSISYRDRIVQRLSQQGFPVDEPGLVAYTKDNRFQLPKLVSAILPTDEEAVEVQQDIHSESENVSLDPKLRVLFRESIIWLQWLMFEGEPGSSLKELSDLSSGQRGVCGAVWGHNDVAYRCRTCECDPTCAICVPCFQNGNHKDHDYFIMYTGGGCCDCGDVTAWKRTGFCSKHRGAEHIQPLSQNYVNSVGPVLDALLVFWRIKLLSAEYLYNNPVLNDFVEKRNATDGLAFVVVEMLLEFCDCSESLLSFVSDRISSSVCLLDILVRAESFLGKFVVQKLHNLLLKLLSEPVFKYEFAKVFLNYYPRVVNEVVKACSDDVLKDLPLLSSFSVQIFTVPTLTLRLVKEMNLLEMLLGCLGDILNSCAGEDGRLQVTKWGYVNVTTLRIIEDVRFVMTHDVVPKFVTHDQRDTFRTWMKILAFVQGTNPQKRETGIPIEEENEHTYLPFALGLYIGNIHSLLVARAFSVSGDEGMGNEIQDLGDEDSMTRLAKVGRLSEESSVCSASCDQFTSASKNAEAKYEIVSSHLFPPLFICLISECLRAIEDWLKADKNLLNVLCPNFHNISNILAVKKTLSQIRKVRLTGSSGVCDKCPSPHNDSHMSVEMDDQLSMGNRSKSVITDMDNARCLLGFDGNTMEGASAIEFDALHVLGFSDWPDIIYDVSSQDISVHIPLHRLLSSLIHKALRKCYSEPTFLNSNRVSSANLVHSDFFGHILIGCHPYGFSAFVMEHPLRNRVFCAEVRAGMWRKNGDSALQSYGSYCSVRCGGLDLELDLFLLQCCAALAPPDLYINRILQRFGLLSYLSLNLEPSSEYEPVLVLEMLTLLIHVLKERRFCGLTTEECLKRELVCRLAVSDATHSQLVTYLPRDLSKKSVLQKVLDRVAMYSDPSGMNQGMYSLRWLYWKELDLYHPRWNPRDLQVSEERYLQFCSISPLTTQLPKWTKIYDPLEGLARVATCKMIVQILHSVMYYAVMTDKLTASRAPDNVLITALHLLALVLDICCLQKQSTNYYTGDVIPMLAFAGEDIGKGLNSSSSGQSLLLLLVSLMRLRKDDSLGYNMEVGNCQISSLIGNLLKKFAEIDFGCMTELQRLAPEVVDHLTKSIPVSDSNIASSTSNVEERKAKARERQAAMMEKMKAEQSKFLESVKSTSDVGLSSPVDEQEECKSDAGHESAQDVCCLCHDPKSGSSVSYLILLQKSRLLSFIDRGPPSWKQIDQSSKVPVAAKQIVSEKSTSLDTSKTLLSSKLVPNAVKKPARRRHSGDINALLEFMRTHYSSVDKILVPCRSDDRKEGSTYSFNRMEDDLYISICKEMHGNQGIAEDKNSPSAEQGWKRCRDAESVLFGKYIVGLGRESSNYASTCNDRPPSEVPSMPLTSDGFGPSDADGVYLSSCGHGVHQECLNRYLSSLRERSRRRVSFEGGHIVDPEKGEFLCPVCRRLANSVLPALHCCSWKAWMQINNSSANSQNIASSLDSTNEGIKSPDFQKALRLLQRAAYIIEKGNVYKDFPMQRRGNISPNLAPLFRMLCGMYFPGKEEEMSQSVRVSPPMIMWDTLKYSLVSVEIAARSGRTSLTPVLDLSSLYRRLKSSNGFILFLFLKTIQSLRSKDPFHVLQRFKGIQLFEKSLCPDASTYESSSGIYRGDNMLHILKRAEMEVNYPDIQFLERASDPVLARDPFSSLMWILFCLPHPFLSCEESFLSLVYLFYAVSVIQAIILYCINYQWKLSELDSDCLIADICKVMGQPGVAHQYFVSTYMDPACNIKDAIRRLSFPYLRRCALLWKLVNSSTSQPFGDTSVASDGLSSIDTILESGGSTAAELIEIAELENMFRIPPLGVVLKDVVIRSQALKWFHHFSKEFEGSRRELVLYLTPAVPFKLMHLPRVYQDLLERYIKQQCPHCEPALCLLCGRLCSTSLKPCCRRDNCQFHASACGSSTGVFLLIKRTTILLQRSARKAPWPSPYLDDFGEEDSNMRRGKPLYINEERYAALTEMVASHGLDQSSKVLGQTTIGSFFVF